MTNPVLHAVEKFAKTTPDAIALQQQDTSISYAALAREIISTQASFQKNGMSRIGLLMDNGPAWAIIDLAALGNKSVLVPLASFFSYRFTSHQLAV